MEFTRFDPNSAAPLNSGIFGFPYSIEESDLILIPVPWDATIYYRRGSAYGPGSIFAASKYIEFGYKDLQNICNKGIAFARESKGIRKKSKKASKYVKSITKNGEMTTDKTAIDRAVKLTNPLCEEMNQFVYNNVHEYINKNKTVGLIGGEHSISLGGIMAHIEKYPDMGILQIDAHCDLRKSFEGFRYSHASVMFNVLEKTNLKKLVQVGVRDYCPEEYKRVLESGGRVETHFEEDIFEERNSDQYWKEICKKMISSLPTDVYISFDIDGLDPSLCPNTGTPVPGGFSFQEATSLIKEVVNSGRKIVGFDLVEVAPGKDGDWDANVAAHLLYKLSGWCLKSQEEKD